MFLRVISAAVLIGALIAGPASAASYKFQLKNESQYAVSGFQTYEDGKWSTWSGVSVAPGEEQTMDWNSAEGDCEVPFRIIYKDVQTEQYTVDWCKIHTITVHDDSVVAE